MYKNTNNTESVSWSPVKNSNLPNKRKISTVRGSQYKAKKQ